MLGTMSTPAPMKTDVRADGAWALWEVLAKGRPEFGRPAVFDMRIAEYLALLHGDAARSDVPPLGAGVHRGCTTGTGGLVTFVDSNWLMSIVVAYQPHFRDQPDGVQVFWGYGLFPDRPGNYVPKTMTECTARRS